MLAHAAEEPDLQPGLALGAEHDKVRVELGGTLLDSRGGIAVPYLDRGGAGLEPGFANEGLEVPQGLVAYLPAIVLDRGIIHSGEPEPALERRLVDMQEVNRRVREESPGRPCGSRRRRREIGRDHHLFVAGERRLPHHEHRHGREPLHALRCRADEHIEHEMFAVRAHNYQVRADGGGTGSDFRVCPPLREMEFDRQRVLGVDPSGCIAQPAHRVVSDAGRVDPERAPDRRPTRRDRLRRQDVHELETCARRASELRSAPHCDRSRPGEVGGCEDRFDARHALALSVRLAFLCFRSALCGEAITLPVILPRLTDEGSVCASIATARRAAHAGR